MERIYEILEQLIPNADFRNAKDLVDSQILTSLNIVRLVAALNDEFDVEITPLHLIPENFNSVENMYRLIQELDGE